MMKPLNQAQISFEARSVNESFGRAAVAAFLSQLDPTVAGRDQRHCPRLSGQNGRGVHNRQDL